MPIFPLSLKLKIEEGIKWAFKILLLMYTSVVVPTFIVFLLLSTVTSVENVRVLGSATFEI